MHLVVPFAAPGSDAGREALRSLSWPRLKTLLAGRSAQRDDGDELSLSPPHERAAAHALGWQGADGQLPWAAWLAAADGLQPGTAAWGLLTPAHWHLGTEQLSLTDPASLALDEATSRAFFDAVSDLFTSEGFAMHWGAPLRWYISHPSLEGLPTASIDRVIGRNVDRWLTPGPKARMLRRLQNEVQMLLYTHPLNAERDTRRQPVLNSFWLSGCGVAQACTGAVTLEPRLRQHALAEDWAAWAKAWAQIDDELPARTPSRITLCGERASLSWALPARGLFKQLGARFGGPDLARELETL